MSEQFKKNLEAGGWKVYAGSGPMMKYLGTAKVELPLLLEFDLTAFGKLFGLKPRPYLCAIAYRFSKN